MHSVRDFAFVLNADTSPGFALGLIQIRIQEASHNADKIAKFANKYWYKGKKILT